MLPINRCCGRDDCELLAIDSSRLSSSQAPSSALAWPRVYFDHLARTISTWMIWYIAVVSVWLAVTSSVSWVTCRGAVLSLTITAVCHVLRRSTSLQPAFRFLPLDAVHSADYADRCSSVRPSVFHVLVYSIEISTHMFSNFFRLEDAPFSFFCTSYISDWYDSNMGVECRWRIKLYPMIVLSQISL